MANPDIGKITCPSCDHPDASVREAKSKKSYIVCEECGFQAFSRDGKSDANIRRKMRPVGPVAPAGHPPTPAEHPPVAEKKSGGWLL